MYTLRRTMAEAVAESDKAPAERRMYLYDEERLRAHLRSRDHLLYEAERDVVPPRPVRWPTGEAVTWRIDRVRYAADPLPTGEPNRSVGHWNPVDQWEVFEVDQGEVAVLVRTAPDTPVEVVRCPAGHAVPLPPGSWHLTYVLAGPAVVTNIYSVARARTSTETKYFSRPTVRAGIRRGDDGLVGYGPDRAPGPARWRTGVRSRDLLDGEENLTGLLTAERHPAALLDPEDSFADALPSGV